MEAGKKRLAGDIGFPILWRPKVQIRSRLYVLKSGDTKTTFSTTQKMAWKDYFSRIFSLSGLFGIRPTIDNSEIDRLLEDALRKLQKKLKIN
jgi:hypothetical protein